MVLLMDTETRPALTPAALTDAATRYNRTGSAYLGLQLIQTARSSGMAVPPRGDTTHKANAIIRALGMRRPVPLGLDIARLMRTA